MYESVESKKGRGLFSNSTLEKSVGRGLFFGCPLKKGGAMDLLESIMPNKGGSLLGTSDGKITRLNTVLTDVSNEEKSLRSLEEL